LEILATEAVVSFNLDCKGESEAFGVGESNLDLGESNLDLGESNLDLGESNLLDLGESNLDLGEESNLDLEDLGCSTSS